MKRLSIASILGFSLVLTSYATSRTPDKAVLEAKALREAEEKLREFVPTLSALEKRFSEDPEVLLGLATIYSHYSPDFEYSKRCALLYRKAVALEPSNKAARIGLVQRVVGDFMSQRGQLLLALEFKQQYAMRENLKEVEIDIPWDDELYKLLCDLLREQGQEKIVIRDFNEARVRLCENFDRTKLPPVMAELEKAEKFEPGNAVYNYLRAQLYFDLDEDERGLEELQKGSRKPYFNTYVIETAAARNRVIREVGFPENYRRTIEENLPLPWGIPAEPKVFMIAKQEQERGNPKKAIEIYEAMIRIENQYNEEPIPGKAGQPPGRQRDRNLSYPFGRMARQQLAKIRPEQGIR